MKSMKTGNYIMTDILAIRIVIDNRLFDSFLAIGLKMRRDNKITTFGMPNEAKTINKHSLFKLSVFNNRRLEKGNFH